MPSGKDCEEERINSRNASTTKTEQINRLDDLNDRELFERALLAFAANSRAANHESRNRSIGTAREEFLFLLNRIDRQTIEKSSSLAEDVQTNRLRFVLCEFFVAKAYELAECAWVENQAKAKDERCSNLTKAGDFLGKFLKRALAMGLVARDFKREVEEAVGISDSDECDYERDDMNRVREKTPEEKRAEKVKRFRKQNELRKRLEKIESTFDRSRNGKKQVIMMSKIMSGTASVDFSSGAATIEGDDEDEDADDDETQREYWFLAIEKAIVDSVESLNQSKEELAMLSGVSEEDVKRIILENNKKNANGYDDDDDGNTKRGIPDELLKAMASLDNDSKNKNKNNNNSRGLEGMMMMNRGAPPAGTSFAPSVSAFMSHKESVVRDARSALFRPSHILPTMTVEEAGEIELRELIERTALSNEREKRKSILESAKTSDELSDEKLYEKRRWDNFKDDNPFGAGNSRRTPTGNNK